MPNIGLLLKDEIRRLAKKEAKALAGEIRREAIRLKRVTVDLKRRVGDLERDNRWLISEEKRRQQVRPSTVPDTGVKARFRSAGVKAMRSKLGLTREEFGKLAGVTANAVYLWEAKGGPLTLKDSTRAALLVMRDLGAREARRRLEALGK